MGEWLSWSERRSHIPEITGSTPVSPTTMGEELKVRRITDDLNMKGVPARCTLFVLRRIYA